METVWDILGVVHAPEVTTRDEESVRDTGTNRESDLNVGSLSPKVRAICLVKAAKGQRPAGTSWLPGAGAQSTRS